MPVSTCWPVGCERTEVNFPSDQGQSHKVLVNNVNISPGFLEIVLSVFGDFDFSPLALPPSVFGPVPHFKNWWECLLACFVLWSSFNSDRSGSGAVRENRWGLVRRLVDSLCVH